jgi:hypothetical protein
MGKKNRMNDKKIGIQGVGFVWGYPLFHYSNIPSFHHSVAGFHYSFEV